MNELPPLGCHAEFSDDYQLLKLPVQLPLVRGAALLPVPHPSAVSSASGCAVAVQSLVTAFLMHLFSIWSLAVIAGD